MIRWRRVLSFQTQNIIYFEHEPTVQQRTRTKVGAERVVRNELSVERNLPLQFISLHAQQHLPRGDYFIRLLELRNFKFSIYHALHFNLSHPRSIGFNKQKHCSFRRNVT